MSGQPGITPEPGRALVPAVQAPAVAAAMVVSENPLVSPRPQPVLVRPGATFADLAPHSLLPLMLRVNGEWLLRAEWSLPVCDGDVIEWHLVRQGAGSRGVLQVLLVVAVLAYLVYSGGDFATAAKIYAVGSAILSIVNLLIPIQQPRLGATDSPQSVYQVALAANQARINQPIPVIYGRMLVFPDFAAQPYGEFFNNDQYYCALFCIGQGNYTFERLQIDDTSINSFGDVQYNILPPGTLNSLVLASVVTAPEVAGQDLNTNVAVGFFAACSPLQTAAAVGIDIVFPGGLGSADSSGNLNNKSVTIKFEAQAIDDFGVATGDAYQLGLETITAKTSTPQRVSFKYTLASPARVQVRATRTDVKEDKSTVLNSPVWSGLRAYLGDGVTNFAPLCATATHLEVRIRATNQLSQQSQRRISCIVRRKLRSWSPGGGWAAEAETRSIAWAMADVWTNPVYGDGLPDSRVDLQSLYDLDQIWAARQDRFDQIFDAKITSWDAVKTIGQAGRAVPFRRAGVCTLVRDQQQTLPVTAFTSRNMTPGVTLGYALATEVTADGVIVEYFDNRAWEWRDVLCPAPGVTTPVNAVRLRLSGITGINQARREGLYQAAQNVYRRKFPKWTTELGGLLPAYGSVVLYAPDLPGWGQAGDVADFNAATLVMNLSEPAVFTAGASAHYISLMRDDGSMTSAIACTPGPTANDVVLAGQPDFTLVLDDASRERPKYIFGAAGQHRIPVRVLGIVKRGRDQSGAQLIEMNGVAEDDRTHAVDNAYLPGPGVVQDPVGGGMINSSLAFNTVVNLSSSKNTGRTSVNGVTIAGLNPAWVLTLDLPTGQTWNCWSKWATDNDPYVPTKPNAWGNSFEVTSAEGVHTSFGADAIAPNGEAARVLFAGGSITGSASYTFWLNEDSIPDNRGGMSIRLTKT